ncbi:MAG: Haloacid dehalogenase-like hydrolase, partial [Chloroflexota bacterium]|nr:Haloacid dehalogenase-like hydrolase [Chloroflexota bacterium]
FVVFWSPDSRPRQFKAKVEVVSALLEQYDLKPGCTLLVGDTEDDIRAAQELGLPFGVVEYGYGRSGFAASLPQQCRVSEFAVVLDIVSR